MTVCIAALSCTNKQPPFIVTVSDTQLSTGHYSIDFGALKLRAIHPKWKAMISGHFSQQSPITSQIEKSLEGISSPSCEQVKKACIETFEAENKRLAEEGVLSKYAMSLESFVQSRQSIGDSLYERLWNEIRQIKVGCDLLVCGFDEQHQGHIFIVRNPTDENPSFITDCNDPGFGVIGSGAYLAESTLYAFGQVWTEDLATTIYQTTYAKFVSESATDVGETTFLQVFDMYGQDFDLGRELEYQLRDQWEKSGRPKIPRTALDKIKKEINKAREKMKIPKRSENETTASR